MRWGREVPQKQIIELIVCSVRCKCNSDRGSIKNLIVLWTPYVNGLKLNLRQRVRAEGGGRCDALSRMISLSLLLQHSKIVKTSFKVPQDLFLFHSGTLQDWEGNGPESGKRRNGVRGREREEEEEKFQSSVLHWCGERRSVRKRAGEHSISWTIKLLKASDGGRELVNIPRANTRTRPSAPYMDSL